jgi:flagellar export protein FliJ
MRARELEKAELRVAEAQLQVLQANEELAKFQNKISQTKQNLETILSIGASINVTQINSYQNFIELLKRKIKQQYNIITEKEEILETKKKEMLQFRQKKMMLDKLKEKELKTYLQELERLDMRMIDEIATSRHNRR